MTNEQKMAQDNQILKIRVGSHLYGTNTPDSDEDYSGVFIANEEYYLGLLNIEQVDFSIISKTADGKNDKDAIDFKLYELRKFINLAIKNSPNTIEQLFVNSENTLFVNDLGNELLTNRHRFLHKGLKQKFIGYALSQRRKMIVKQENYDVINEAYQILDKSEYKWAIEEPAFEKYVNKKLIKEKPSKHYFVGDIYIPRNVTIKRAKEILATRLGRVGHRQELILKHGFDCKFGGHLIRLLLQGKELLETGDLKFPLKYKDELLDIRNGKYTAQQVIDYSEQLDDEINIAYEKSNLPESPDFNYINQLCIDLIKMQKGY